MITPLYLNNVQLRFGRVQEKKSPYVVIHESKRDDLSEKETSLHQEEEGRAGTGILWAAVLGQ